MGRSGHGSKTEPLHNLPCTAGAINCSCCYSTSIGPHNIDCHCSHTSTVTITSAATTSTTTITTTTVNNINNNNNGNAAPHTHTIALIRGDFGHTCHSIFSQRAARFSQLCHIGLLSSFSSAFCPNISRGGLRKLRLLVVNSSPPRASGCLQLLITAIAAIQERLATS
jgi:hypothetical protein